MILQEMGNPEPLNWDYRSFSDAENFNINFIHFNGCSGTKLFSDPWRSARRNVRIYISQDWGQRQGGWYG